MAYWQLLSLDVLSTSVHVPLCKHSEIPPQNPGRISLNRFRSFVLIKKNVYWLVSDAEEHSAF